MVLPTSPVAIVIGGSSGPGREIARQLASLGYAIVVVYLHDQGAAETAVEEILAAHGSALAVRADPDDDLDAERLWKETLAAFGGVDVVVQAVAPRFREHDPGMHGPERPAYPGRWSRPLAIEADREHP